MLIFEKYRQFFRKVIFRRFCDSTISFHYVRRPYSRTRIDQSNSPPCVASGRPAADVLGGSGGRSACLAVCRECLAVVGRDPIGPKHRKSRASGSFDKAPRLGAGGTQGLSPPGESRHYRAYPNRLCSQGFPSPVLSVRSHGVRENRTPQPDRSRTNVCLGVVCGVCAFGGL